MKPKFQPRSLIGRITVVALLALCLSRQLLAAAPKTETKTLNPQDFTNAVVNVAASVGPAVVSIQAEKVERVQPYSPFSGSPFEDEMLNRFFSDFFGEPPMRELHRSSLGSGVIIDEKGYILTNDHVVRDTDKITVTLADGREFVGTVKGTDPRSDLAVVKIDAPDLPYVHLGDSDALQIGQWVVAIGYPFGFLLPNTEPAVTAGVISALHRSLPRTERRDTDYTDLIQTDAAINPCNSGGPLVNLNGEIIGINVAIFSTSGGYQGIGFTIPSNAARRIVARLIEGKSVDYGWIGVSVQDIDSRLAEYFNLPNAEGVLVNKILEGGPASRAGIKEGDIIITFNGKPTKNTVTLIKMIGNTPVDEQVKMKIWRDKKSQEVDVKIAKRPAFDAQGQIILPDNEQSDQNKATIHWRGLTVRDIPASIKNRILSPNVDGVIVTDVENKSPAQLAGLKKGDVIISVNQRPISNLKELDAVLSKAKGDCLLRTVRGFFVVKE